MYEPIKEETKEQYLKIWTHYSICHLNQEQIAEMFGCSQDTIYNAIKWCSGNRIQFESSILIEAAKEAVETKLRDLNKNLKEIKEEEPVNWNAFIGINKLIKEYQELLWKLQAVIQDRSIITINSTQVNQVLKARDEVLEGLDDEQRKELVARVREITNKQSND